MEKKIVVGLLLFSIILFSIIQLYPKEKDVLEIEISGQKFYLEKAITQEEKSKGLMDRSYLEENKGMVFIWDTEEMRFFWMKNTLIPLDIIFLNSSGSIASIVHSAQPCESLECPSYPSELPARYVIELNAGKAQSLNISNQDIININ